MHIEPIDEAGPHKTGTLDGVTVDDIVRVLGFRANVKDDPDKVVNSWGFTVDGVYAAIWDYYGSHIYNSFSVYDPNGVIPKLFSK